VNCYKISRERMKSRGVQQAKRKALGRRSPVGHGMVGEKTRMAIVQPFHTGLKELGVGEYSFLNQRWVGGIHPS